MTDLDMLPAFTLEYMAYHALTDPKSSRYSLEGSVSAIDSDAPSMWWFRAKFSNLANQFFCYFRHAMLRPSIGVLPKYLIAMVLILATGAILKVSWAVILSITVLVVNLFLVRRHRAMEGKTYKSMDWLPNSLRAKIHPMVQGSFVDVWFKCIRRPLTWPFISPNAADSSKRTGLVVRELRDCFPILNFYKHIQSVIQVSQVSNCDARQRR